MAKIVTAAERRRLNERLADAARKSEGELLQTVTRGYGAAARDIDREIARLESKMAAAVDAGEDVTVGWLRRAGRLASLKTQVDGALSRFVKETAPEIVDGKQALFMAGQEHAIQLLTDYMGSPPAAARKLGVTFAELNSTAAETAAARATVGGAPIRDVLARYSTETSGRIVDTLFSGVARGRNPTAIARDLRSDLNAGAYNALRFARTETITAYRDARLDTWRENRDFMSGWEWSAADDERTCPFCSEMDGQVFELDDPFETHPNCRCSPKPITKSWDEVMDLIRENRDAA